MTDYLFLIFIFLSAGVIAVPIASRFKLGSVLGYLIAGIAVVVTHNVDIQQRALLRHPESERAS